ncbi:MAG: hypothetical protein R3A45_08605 [Bdellovibrionota bacterium]
MQIILIFVIQVGLTFLKFGGNNMKQYFNCVTLLVFTLLSLGHANMTLAITEVEFSREYKINLNNYYGQDKTHIKKKEFHRTLENIIEKSKIFKSFVDSDCFIVLDKSTTQCVSKQVNNVPSVLCSISGIQTSEVQAKNRYQERYSEPYVFTHNNPYDMRFETSSADLSFLKRNKVNLIFRKNRKQKESLISDIQSNIESIVSAHTASIEQDHSNFFLKILHSGSQELGPEDYKLRDIDFNVPESIVLHGNKSLKNGDYGFVVHLLKADFIYEPLKHHVSMSNGAKGPVEALLGYTSFVPSEKRRGTKSGQDVLESIREERGEYVLIDFYCALGRPEDVSCDFSKQPNECFVPYYELYFNRQSISRMDLTERSNRLASYLNENPEYQCLSSFGTIFNIPEHN